MTIVKKAKITKNIQKIKDSPIMAKKSQKQPKNKISKREYKNAFFKTKREIKIGSESEARQVPTTIGTRLATSVFGRVA